MSAKRRALSQLEKITFLHRVNYVLNSWMTYIQKPPAHSSAHSSAQSGAQSGAHTPSQTDMPASGLSSNNSYDPAEYRWVPVRRRPRHDGWTDEKQRRFIEVLADTGLVNLAAKTVGMSRESAGRLRRSPHGAAFSRAWDAARRHAGTVLEDIAFERAIEGVEHNVYNEYGEAICTKRVYNDRLLTFLLRNLNPERYARDTLRSVRAGPQSIAEQTSDAGQGDPERLTAPADDSVDACLQAMEPELPAPLLELMDAEELQDVLCIADAADGVLPQFLCEQMPIKSSAQEAADDIAASHARGKAALDRMAQLASPAPNIISHQDMVDITRAIDPGCLNQPTRKRFR
jgi:hypothetical protein